MEYDTFHPADSIVMTMNRIYKNGMTTTSGGNLSVLDSDGNIWITPTGVDKGSLTRADICMASADGVVTGPRPSVELPFHASVYRARPDIRAVIHAHPPSLVAFSLTRSIPRPDILPDVRHICGDPGIAEYAAPGSEKLGNNIAAKFAEGYDVIILENHGAVSGAKDLPTAFQRFEALELSATAQICARRLGKLKTISEEADIPLFEYEEFMPGAPSARECVVRRDIAALSRRCCRQKLFTSALGTFSARLSEDSFLVTPRYADNICLKEADIVLMRRGRRESGKTPSRWAELHRMIYERHPEINAVASGYPPNAMAFAATDFPFEPRTIPESYIQLREVKKIPYAMADLEAGEAASLISTRSPVIICENGHVLATGSSAINAFDRLEVAEATARSIISAREIGELAAISDDEIREIAAAFKLV